MISKSDWKKCQKIEVKHVQTDKDNLPFTNTQISSFYFTECYKKMHDGKEFLLMRIKTDES